MKVKLVYYFCFDLSAICVSFVPILLPGHSFPINIDSSYFVSSVTEVPKNCSDIYAIILFEAVS